MNNINEMLKNVGYTDSPLRREVKQVFIKWLQQYDSLLVIREIIKELEK